MVCEGQRVRGCVGVGVRGEYVIAREGGECEEVMGGGGRG